VALLALLLALPPAALVPTLHGLYAPGSAEAVAPMIDVEADYRHPSEGRFLLTTVVAQTPILAWQWFQARYDPTLRLLPPAAIVPQNTTPQELMSINHRLLDESTLAATVVGMRLAGYEPQLRGEAVAVISVLPQSRARDLLQPGDRILALNGVPTTLATDLIAQVQAQTDADSVMVLIERAGRQERVQAPLMAPATPDDPPRLGITVQTIGLAADLPFPVEITPKKILGGPSAGLMFTLTLYDLLTPGDLTQGRTIAGTGTISMDGNVGPVGGVAQKVAAAEQAGAAYFLTPPANAREARRAAREIIVIEVASAQAAVEALRNLPPPAE
jgi:PDZ domain-containing protein